MQNESRTVFLKVVTLLQKTHYQLINQSINQANQIRIAKQYMSITVTYHWEEMQKNGDKVLSKWP
jgi:hypothetical protein